MRGREKEEREIELKGGGNMKKLKKRKKERKERRDKGVERKEMK
jgi:hypothetical protein